MYALVTGTQYVATGCSQLALVIGADTNSRIVDPHDKKIYPLFGDGAGAVLLARGSDEQGLIAYTLGADGSGEELLCMKAGGSRNPASGGNACSRRALHADGRPRRVQMGRPADRPIGPRRAASTPR